MFWPIMIFIFALFDSISTIILIHYGYAEEINPVMDWFLGAHPGLFILNKMVLTGLAVAWMYRWRHRAEVQLVTRFAAVFYGTIAAMHCATYIYYGTLN